MEKKKKSKKSSAKNSDFARNLNIFIALAGLSYTIFLVLSKWSQIQRSVSENFETMKLVGLAKPVSKFLKINLDGTKWSKWFSFDSPPEIKSILGQP